ncbi:hypothetical protein PMAYCL1PPCAC_00779, partial [Pristionchus mayeri]
LTDKHYIFKGDCSHVNDTHVPYALLQRVAVAADGVRVGDCLFTLGTDRVMREVHVVRKGRHSQTGIYSPMT